MDWFWRFRVSSSPFQSRTAVAENASSFDVLPRVVKFEIRKRRTGWKHACTYYSIQSVSNPVILNLWSHEWDGEDAGGQCQTRSVNLGKPWYVQYNARWHAMRDGISELSRGEGTKESPPAITDLATTTSRDHRHCRCSKLVWECTPTSPWSLLHSGVKDASASY
jgi:hypothetical protein